MTEFSHAIESNIRNAGSIIRYSKYTTVLTGAGISTPSGIPDFRSTGSGLWEKYDPFEVASLNAFRYQPQRFFDWMRPLAKDIINADPNLAHLGLARLEEAGFLQNIITQNIDGLHQRAGSRNVIEVHGSWRTLTCIRCYQQVESSNYMPAYLDKGTVPLCPNCNGILKPDAVLFGEQLPVKSWLAAMEASKKCDLMIVVGSSLEVMPVAGLPMRALENGAHLIIINHTSTYIDVRADVLLPEDVAEVIPRIVEEVIRE